MMKCCTVLRSSSNWIMLLIALCCSTNKRCFKKIQLFLVFIFRMFEAPVGNAYMFPSDAIVGYAH